MLLCTLCCCSVCLCLNKIALDIAMTHEEFNADFVAKFDTDVCVQCLISLLLWAMHVHVNQRTVKFCTTGTDK